MVELKRPKYRKEISLIPGGQLQFLDLAFDIKSSDVAKVNSNFWEYPDAENHDKYWLRGLTYDNVDEQWIDRQSLELATDPRTDIDIGRRPGTGTKIEPEYQINPTRAIKPFLNRWMPLPVFRAENINDHGDPEFANGPTDWARVRISEVPQPDRESMTHSVTVVFDTFFEADPDAYKPEAHEDQAQLTIDDIESGAPYLLAHQLNRSAWWLSREWVESWVKDAYIDHLKKTVSERAARVEEWDYKVEYLARFITLIDVLEAADILPQIRLAQTVKKNTAPINVDLVLDIGNSRTCGMLIERSEGKASSMSDSTVLQIRDLMQPELSYHEPFTSNVAFSRAFFHDRGDDLGGEITMSGRTREGFDWPSLVRVGPEASRLAARSRREEGQTSMSSPKRYLWDRELRPLEWRFCPATDSEHAKERPVTEGSFALHISDSGAPIIAWEARRKSASHLYPPGIDAEYTENSVFNPVFSRSSLMMFLLSEVVLHALVQINSPAYRFDHSNPDIPRKLSRVILTVPTAMPIVERRILEQWANWAIDTIWQASRWAELPDDVPNDYRVKPRVKCDWDEATATQMVYLYNEIAVKFAGDVDAYFSFIGRQRDGFDRETLRIASIDVGGGTSDLIITTYENKTQGASGVITPKQEFREGFNIAGDNILKAIIETHFMSAFQAAAEKDGLRNAREILMQKFSNSSMPERDKNLRAQFVSQIAIPFGLEILRAVETADLWDPSQTVQLSYNEVFKSNPEPLSDVLEFVAGIFVDGGAAGFDIRELAFNVDLGSVATTIATTMRPVLTELLEVVHRYDCDKLLLAGRPSRMPILHSIILQGMAVPPTDFISLSEYKVGHWYPFWSPGGRIADPKTTACVGAVLCSLAEGNLQNFRFETADLIIKSTARNFGELEASGQIKAANVLFSDIDMDADTPEDSEPAVISFNAPIYIGFRQLSVERWSASPFCYLDFAGQRAIEDAAGLLPFKVKMKFFRQSVNADGDSGGPGSLGMYVGDPLGEGALSLLSQEITDKNGDAVNPKNIVLKLKTMREEIGYWIDTGILEIR
jgi:hypothetical protein